MKKNLTELVFILDESGSMAGLTDDTIGGFNSLISKQKSEEGEALVSTVFFSSGSKVVHDRLKLENIPELTRADYVPSGCTALLDAVGDTIRHIADIHKYARDEDRPEKTLFIITTDGMENASRKFTLREIKHMISKEQEKYGWEFMFLGANIDAAETAGSMGIRTENAVNYRADECGTGVLYEAVGCAVSSMRQKRTVGSAWKASIEADNNSRGSSAPSAPKKTSKGRIFGIFK